MDRSAEEESEANLHCESWWVRASGNCMEFELATEDLKTI